MKTNLGTKGYIADYFILIISRIVLVIIVAMVGVAIFDSDNKGEASIGSFDVIDFNQNWTLDDSKNVYEVTLPIRIENEKGQLVSLTNTLPENLSDNMSLMMRASMEDMYIYVGDELREEYSSRTLEDMSYYIPSAYVVCKLNSEDSGKNIRIDIRFKSQGFLNSVSIGYGNDVWYPILWKTIPVNVAAFFVLVLGIILTIAVSIFEKVLKTNSPSRQLGLLMIDIAIWLLVSQQ